MIHHSPLPDVAIPDVCVTEYVLRHAARLGDKAALIDGVSGERLSYRQLDDAVRRLAGGLAASGFGPGQVLALMAPNCPQFAVVFHAVALAGGAITTLNPTYTADEVRHQLKDAGASILVSAAACLPNAQLAIHDTGVKQLLVLEDTGATRQIQAISSLFGARMEHQVPVNPALDVVVLPYSSGTTGLNKGVQLTHRNLVANIVQADAVLNWQENETFVVALPFFHIYGMNVMMNPALATGATIVTMARFDLPQFLQLHQDHAAARCFVVPPMIVALAKHPIVDQYNLSSLKEVISGAAPMSAELSNECAKRLGCEVVQGFGMTELSPVSHFTPRGKNRAGAVGLALPNTESMLVDPVSGEAVGVGVEGELWVRGPQVMLGYLNKPQATAATINPEGWLRTGDIGKIDSDGYLFIVDRLKELIKFKGFQVPPAELEALLLTHPDVADAAVVGRPDDEAGEIPVGFVVLKAGRSISSEELRAFVAGQVASYKQIRELFFIETIPKSASGKILRRVLRSELR